MDVLLKFRYPHLKVAKDNMNIRTEGSLGSGGYTSDILERLLSHTVRSRAKLVERLGNNL